MSLNTRDFLQLLPTPSAPALARKAVRDMGDDCFPPTVTDTAELLTSELVTNAITHGSGMVTLAIRREGPSLAVAVSDDAPGVPVVLPEQLLAPGGRGLRMVELLASAWGVKRREDGPGKIVWFRVS